MYYRYHVHVRDCTKRSGPEASYSAYEDARAHAERAYSAAGLDTLVEITHAGLVVWGPFVVGGNRDPRKKS